MSTCSLSGCEFLRLMTHPFGKIIFFNLASPQLCEPDTVKSSHLSDQILAVTSPNPICLLAVPRRQQMSYYQMAHTSLSPNGYRELKYPPTISQGTLSSWCSSCCCRMQRMHVTCGNTGSRSRHLAYTNQWRNSVIEALSLCKHGAHWVSNKLIIILALTLFS